MSFGNTAENAILNLILNGVTYPDIAEDDTTSPATSLEIHLHTASPGEGGTGTTNETTYTGYVVQTVSRGGSGWNVSGGSASPASNIVFPSPTAGSGTITHASVTKPDDEIIFYGVLQPSITITISVPPTILTTSTITLD